MTSHAHRLKTVTALALALGAIAPTTASARVALDPPASQTTRATANVSVPRASAFTDSGARAARAPKVQVLRVSNGGSFDWRDAGIGAAGGVGIAMLGVAGALVITGVRRSDRRPVQTPWSRPDRELS